MKFESKYNNIHTKNEFENVRLQSDGHSVSVPMI